MSLCKCCLSGGAFVALLIGVLGAPLVAPDARCAVYAKAADGHLKFELYEDGSKEFRWRLKAANGEVLATGGQGYKAKADAKHAIERIKADADKLTFESYEDTSKEFRWRLKAANGQVIGTSSQGYKDKADCEKAIDLVKKGAAAAEVEDK